jgi:hypothetical protein
MTDVCLPCQQTLIGTETELEPMKGARVDHGDNRVFLGKLFAHFFSVFQFRMDETIYTQNNAITCPEK